MSHYLINGSIKVHVGAVVECELQTLVLAYAVATGAVLHVKKADVVHEWDADGA